MLYLRRVGGRSRAIRKVRRGTRGLGGRKRTKNEGVCAGGERTSDPLAFNRALRQTDSEGAEHKHVRALKPECAVVRARVEGATRERPGAQHAQLPVCYSGVVLALALREMES